MNHSANRGGIVKTAAGIMGICLLAACARPASHVPEGTAVFDIRTGTELTDRQAKSYGKMYAHQDGQDLLAMVSLTQISRLLKLQAGRQFEDTQLESRLAAIDKLLDSRSDKEISCTGTRNSL